MKYGYAVKYNGVIYPTGAEVPVGEDNKVVDENKESSNTEEKHEVKSHTKTEINRMSLEDLKSVATENGIRVTEESTGKYLKEEIINKLGL